MPCGPINDLAPGVREPAGAGARPAHRTSSATTPARCRLVGSPMRFAATPVQLHAAAAAAGRAHRRGAALAARLQRGTDRGAGQPLALPPSVSRRSSASARRCPAARARRLPRHGHTTAEACASKLVARQVERSQTAESSSRISTIFFTRSLAAKISPSLARCSPVHLVASTASQWRADASRRPSERLDRRQPACLFGTGAAHRHRERAITS